MLHSIIGFASSNPASRTILKITGLGMLINIGLGALTKMGAVRLGSHHG